MLPYIRDPSKLPNISVIYSGWSSIVLVLTSFILFSSKKYLKFGDFEMLPLYGFYTLSEFSKWAFINSKFHSTPPYGPKSSAGVIKEVLKQVRNVGTYNLVKSAAVFISGVVFYYVLAIFFGAALFEAFTETFMFSLLMTILTVLPLCLNLGHESVVELVEGICPDECFDRLLLRGVLVTWVGAWLGAFVIPLDWSRPWQRWPVPCCFGAISALAVYHIASCFYHLTHHLRTKTY